MRLMGHKKSGADGSTLLDKSSKGEIEVKSSQVIPSVPIKADLQKPHGGSELQDQIRARAFQLYEQRGRDDGRDLDDWLQAEAELSQVQKAA